jgi:hypothetical protein
MPRALKIPLRETDSFGLARLHLRGVGPFFEAHSSLVLRILHAPDSGTFQFLSYDDGCAVGGRDKNSRET